MKKWTFYLIIFIVNISFTQEQTVHSIYFETDIHQLKPLQSEAVVYFLKLIDTTKIEKISIFGYCDDIGKVDYNYKLSQKRANNVKEALVKNGIKNKIFVTIEGKGKIVIDEDLEKNIPEARSKNRRVDVVIFYKPNEVNELKIPGVYKTLKKDAVVGDRIYLQNVLFERGRSKLSLPAIKELNAIALILLKNKKINIEIQGHVCCTPPYQKEAIDMDTQKRELSKNRAEVVYKFFIAKRISKERLTYKGYGNSQPLGKKTELDRRVELVVTKN